MTVTVELRPVTFQVARRFVAEHHRHAGPPQGWLFGVGLYRADDLIAVGIAGRPVARGADDGRTVEITRVCTLGDANACSTLYGALCRAAKALGYRRAITYTLATEPGSSPAAAGFVRDGDVSARPSWASASFARYDHDLFGNPRRDPGPKTRWVRELEKPPRSSDRVP